MKRWVSCIIVGAIVVGVAFAQSNFQTVTNQMVGPGMRYFKVIEPTKPWSIDVLEVHLTDPYLVFQSCKGHEVLTRPGVVGGSKELTTAMVKRNHGESHRVVAAINADFFDGDGKPVNIQVEKGQIVCMPNGWSAIGFSPENKPLLERLAFAGKILHKGNSEQIHLVNRPRGENQLVLYNSFYGSSTATNAWGTEVLLAPLTAWMVNDTVLCVVDSVGINKGNMTIPKGKAILSGHGQTVVFLNTLTKGDTVQLILQLPPLTKRVKEMVGGFPRIILNGTNYALAGYKAEGGTATFATDRHPRTAVGFNQDSTYLYLVVVDGRQPALSVGMSLPELADFMLSLGCYHAVNLDGGGSSTMVVRDKIVNSPSDGSERLVANALLLISTAPRREVCQLEIVPKTIRILEGESIAFKIAGLDTFYNVITANPSDFRLSVDSRLGKITPQGVFTAASQRDSGYVYFQYKDVRDSAYVVVKTLEKLTIRPRSAVTDTLNPIQFTVYAEDSDGKQIQPKLTWKVSDPSIGTLDATGRFTPKRRGTTLVIIQAAGISDTARVQVEVGRGIILLNGMENVNQWRLSGLNLDSAFCRIAASNEYATEGTHSIRVDYQFTFQSPREYWVYLDTHLPIFGVPDSIRIDVRLDSAQHSIYLFAANNDGEWFRFVPRLRAKNTNAWNTVGVNTTQYLQETPNSTFYYPLTFVRIGVKLTCTRINGKIYRGSLYFDNLQVSYPLKSEVKNHSINQIPNTFTIWQNYPNPFNERTQIRVYSDQTQFLHLYIVDMLGRKIDTVFKGKLASGMHQFIIKSDDWASGVYFLRCEPTLCHPIRMVLLK